MHVVCFSQQEIFRVFVTIKWFDSTCRYNVHVLYVTIILCMYNRLVMQLCKCGFFMNDVNVMYWRLVIHVYMYKQYFI